MRFPRSSGILLHPTSLPSPYGIGDLGREAIRFVDGLAEAGQSIWQVLPLGPTGYGDSPYQSFSCFAGNPLLISLDELAGQGLIPERSLADTPPFPPDRTDYGAVIPWKRQQLENASARFFADEANPLRQDFESFCHEQAHWLEDYALFGALKDAHGGAVWTEWEEGYARREPTALHRARERYAGAVRTVKFTQFQFYRQWQALRAYANTRGLRLVGDIPIYAAHDSADVWARREVFQLDEQGGPTVVGGVPPDYFSKTGQLWGNPLYRWDYLAEHGYDWWVERVRAALALYDIVRIDHFRGFEAYWEVPAGERTAVNGRWGEGPRDGLFHALRQALGTELPIIAENLGVITDEVEALRERFNLPGMAVLQFGFGHDAASSGFPPHTFTRDLVAYTGTHDNDTTLGWWQHLRREPAVRRYIKSYLNTSGREFNWVAIRALMASVANTVVFPLQDVLGLGGEGRMNRPGTAQGNWQWRFREGQFTEDEGARLRELTEMYGRLMR
jgi:4-alpha-glucanotransferase